MAPPPKHVITRKLVKKFFNNYLPKEPIYAREEKEKLFDCYKRHGLGSHLCKEYEMLYDFIEERSAQYRARLNSMQFKQTVMQNLRKPKYKHELKGRYKTFMKVYSPTEKDGVN
mmetsp:Transcript_17756/g.15550  ORF Transcript_17756/g.15550 Transcript_17756/m.15550 type:complete len:114 (+) Transcript_17756:88-429(+)